MRHDYGHDEGILDQPLDCSNPICIPHTREYVINLIDYINIHAGLSGLSLPAVVWYESCLKPSLLQSIGALSVEEFFERYSIVNAWGG